MGGGPWRAKEGAIEEARKGECAREDSSRKWPWSVLLSGSAGWHEHQECHFRSFAHFSSVTWNQAPPAFSSNKGLPLLVPGDKECNYCSNVKITNVKQVTLCLVGSSPAWLSASVNLSGKLDNINFSFISYCYRNGNDRTCVVFFLTSTSSHLTQRPEH